MYREGTAGLRARLAQRLRRLARVTELSRRLRSARERAGLEIADVSARTKIKPAFLLALERGEWQQLPGRFFTRGFLRTYAAEVGLPPDAIVREFDAIVEPPQPVDPVPLPQLDGSTPRPRRTTPVIISAAVLLVLALVWGGSGTAPRGELGAVATAGTAEASALAASALGATPAQPVDTAAPAPASLTLEIRPTAATWISATADGQPALYRLLDAGEHVSLNAQRELSLRIGNAGGFEYALNGAPGRPLGTTGEVRDVQFTLDNYRTFRR